MTAPSVPVFVSRTDEAASAAAPPDRTPEVMRRLRSPFQPPASAETADAGGVTV